jgi:hypothetical protein
MSILPQDLRLSSFLLSLPLSPHLIEEIFDTLNQFQDRIISQKEFIEKISLFLPFSESLELIDLLIEIEEQVIRNMFLILFYLE